jgi:hypothetical protein
MAMFPDDFPFNRREREAEVAETQAPIVEAQPLAANAFPDNFPFNKREAEAQVEAPADGAAVVAEADAQPRFTPATSIFPAGFPFVDPEPEPVPVQPAPAAQREAVSVVEAAGANMSDVELTF